MFRKNVAFIVLIVWATWVHGAKLECTVGEFSLSTGINAYNKSLECGPREDVCCTRYRGKDLVEKFCDNLSLNPCKGFKHCLCCDMSNCNQ